MNAGKKYKKGLTQQQTNTYEQTYLRSGSSLACSLVRRTILFILGIWRQVYLQCWWCLRPFSYMTSASSYRHDLCFRWLGWAGLLRDRMMCSSVSQDTFVRPTVSCHLPFKFVSCAVSWRSRNRNKKSFFKKVELWYSILSLSTASVQQNVPILGS